MNLHSLAKIAGVSKSTLSRALAGHPAVAPETRERLVRLAAQYHYQPDGVISEAMASMRRRSVQGNLAAVYLPAPPDNTFERRRTGALVRRTEESGYHIDVFCPEKFGGTHLRNTLKARGVRGCIVMPATHLPLDETFRFLSEELPCVLIGEQSLPGGKPWSVGCDLFMAGRLSVTEACLRGYKRVGLAFPKRPRDPEHRFRAGAEEAARQLGISVIRMDFTSHEQMFENLVAWTTRSQIDCLIQEEVQCCRVLEAAGFRIPEEIGVIDWHANAREEPLAGVNQCDEDVSQVAADLLIGRLRRRGLAEMDRINTLVQPKWKEGATMRPRKRTSLVLEKDTPWEVTTARAKPQPIDISPYANCFKHSARGWFGNVLPGNLFGRQEFYGVPFYLPECGPDYILFRSLRTPPAGVQPVETVELPLPAFFESLYILHGCGWIREVRSFAQYTLEYCDGKKVTVETVPQYGSEPNENANIQDWWPEDEPVSSPAVRPLILVDATDWTYTGYLHVLRIENSRPETEARALRITVAPDTSSTLAVIGLTAW